MDDSNRLENKIDNIVEKIGNIDVTLGKQSVILDIHVKRTNLLEAKIIPLEKHVTVVNGVLKFVGLIAVFIAIIEGLLKILKLL